MGDRCGWLCLGLACSALACAGAVADAEDLQEAQEAQKAQAEVAAKQRQQQIAAQMQHMQQMFMPAVHAELELARQTCGSLPADARKKIRAACTDALQAFAKQMAEQGNGIPGARGHDVRKLISKTLAAALKPHAKPEEFAAYEREQAARIARRNRTASVLIVSRVDCEIQLSQAQREKIEADLEDRWDVAWLDGLADVGMLINNRQPAPDFADKCIRPHLDDRQRAEWKTWCDQAGWARHGQRFFQHFQGLTMQPDPWWSP